MKVKVQDPRRQGERRHRAQRRRCSASSRAPTSCTASSPGSSRSAAARPAAPASAPTSPAPARSSVARRAAVRPVTAIAALRSSSAVARPTAPASATSIRRLNKKVRALGLQDGALAAKAKAGQLIVLDNLDVARRQDQGAGGTARQARPRQDGAGDRRRRAQRRLRPRFVATCTAINLLPAIGANVYDILQRDTLVLTRAAVEKLEARFNG